MKDHSNRELSSINSEAEEETLTLGGPTAQAEGTAYQFVSDIGRQVASETGVAGSADTDSAADEPENNEQSASAGKDPELYYDKQVPN